jgi:hypothetical protein
MITVDPSRLNSRTLAPDSSSGCRHDQDGGDGAPRDPPLPRRHGRLAGRVECRMEIRGQRLPMPGVRDEGSGPPQLAPPQEHAGMASLRVPLLRTLQQTRVMLEPGEVLSDRFDDQPDGVLEGLGLAGDDPLDSPYRRRHELRRDLAQADRHQPLAMVVCVGQLLQAHLRGARLGRDQEEEAVRPVDSRVDLLIQSAVRGMSETSIHGWCPVSRRAATRRVANGASDR